MKKLNILLALLISIGLTSYSCKKDEGDGGGGGKDTYYIEKVVDADDGIMADFSYDNDNRLSAATIVMEIDTSDKVPPTKETFNIKLNYKSGSQLEYVSVVNGDEKDSLAFDYNNETITFVGWQKKGSGKYEIMGKQMLKLNADGTIAIVELFDYNDGQYVADEKTMLTWKDGNCIKADVIEYDGDDQYKSSSTYVYDDKVNPLKSFLFIASFADEYDIISKSNTLKETYVDEEDSGNNETTEYKYTYNDKGYPLTAVVTDSDGDKSNITYIYK